MSRVGILRIGLVAVWLLFMGFLVRGNPEVRSTGTTAVPNGDAADPVPEGTWMSVYMHGRKIGYTHDRYVRDGDGYRFLEESLLRMKVLDAEETVRLQVRGETDSVYILRRFHAFMDSGVGQFSARGEVERDDLLLTFDIGGDTQTRRIHLDGGIFLPAGVRRTLVRSGLEPGKRVVSQVFDPSLMQSRSMVSTVVRREVLRLPCGSRSVWRVREEFRSMVSTVWIDDGGHVLREEGPLGLVAVRDTAENVLAKGWEKGEAFDLTSALAVPVEGRIPSPRKSKHLELEIGGIPVSLVPTDERQRFIGTKLVVDVEDMDAAGTFEIPCRDERKKGDLAGTPFLQVGHPRIRAVVKDALGGRTGARAAADALRKWVFRYLKKVPTASIPNALQVLETGVGDCNEHAVLFAAMARAAGLPARMIAGVVYARGTFLYHAWDEVWLGSGWVSVDATFDQMPADATHLKFVTGGPDMYDRMLEVIGRLSVKILAAG